MVYLFRLHVLAEEV